MSSSLSRARKITLTLPETLLERLDERVSRGQRSRFIAEAIEERLIIEEQLSALDAAAGTWTDENHPDMATPEEMDRWLTDLRGAWAREADNGSAAA